MKAFTTALIIIMVACLICIFTYMARKDKNEKQFDESVAAASIALVFYMMTSGILFVGHLINGLYKLLF